MKVIPTSQLYNFTGVARDGLALLQLIWTDHEIHSDADRQVDVRLPGKGNSNTHGAEPVHPIITMIKWFRASRLSIKNTIFR
jgi:hypothetical protein